MFEKTCAQCRNKFETDFKQAKFCGQVCRNIHKNNEWATRKHPSQLEGKELKEYKKLKQKQNSRIQWGAIEPKDVVSKRLKVMRG